MSCSPALLSSLWLSTGPSPVFQCRSWTRATKAAHNIPGANSSGITASLELPTVCLVTQPRRIFAARTHCWLVFSLLSSRSFQQSCFPASESPACTAAWDYSVRCRALNLLFLNLMQFLFPACWCLPVWWLFPSLVLSAVLAKVHMNLFIHIVCKTLDSV